MAPPQANATISKVTAATAATGGRDDWDTSTVTTPAEPAGSGAVKWTGAARCYYRERTVKSAAGGELNVELSRTVILETAAFDAMTLDTDDVLTLERDGKAPLTARASVIERRALARIPAHLQTTRLELETE
jgi:hypothetical protein